MSAEQHHNAHEEAPVYSDSASAMPPDYTSRAGSIASRAPKAPMTTEQREAMLTKFAEERSRSNDNWGGHKGSAGQFAANDPTRPFRRLSQIIRGGVAKGEKKIPWTKPRTPEDGDKGWGDDGYKHEVEKGDQEGLKVA